MHVIDNIPYNIHDGVLSDTPPAPTTQCSLFKYEGGFDVSIQWSSSFNSQHAVERYRVSVNPEPSPSCSSDQVIPSEDYSCPGLSPERNYSITVSAINCGDEVGESDTLTVVSYSGARIVHNNRCVSTVHALITQLSAI